MSIMRCFVVMGCLLMAGLARADESALVSATLDSFHQSAARADSASYFAAMTEDVVFLGTDGSERWQGGDFRDFVTANFSAGRGWTYLPVQRSIIISAGGDTAWFDELLDNDALGTCRGSGVLVKSASGWKVAQYNLSVPVPNAIVQQVVTEIAALGSAQEPANSTAPDLADTATVLEPSIQAADAPAELAPSSTEPPSPEPQAAATSKQECSRKRFKTNRKAGC